MKSFNLRPGLILLAALVALSGGCSKTTGVGGTASEATAQTLKVNAQFAKNSKLDDPQDFEDAKRGFIARPRGNILAADGSVLHAIQPRAFTDAQRAGAALNARGETWHEAGREFIGREIELAPADTGGEPEQRRTTAHQRYRRHQLPADGDQFHGCVRQCPLPAAHGRRA